MKITIKGSLKELSELAKAFSGAKTVEKNADFPPLLTELAKNKNTNLFFGDGHIQTGDEIAATIKRNHEIINRFAEAVRNADKENAPQTEAAEQEYIDPIAFEEIVCKFADCIRNRPGKNGKIRRYKDMKLSEFVRGDLFLK